REAPRGIDLEHRALGREPAVGSDAAKRRAGLPVAREPRSSEPFASDLGTRDRVPDAFRRGADVDLVEVTRTLHGALFEPPPGFASQAHEGLGVLANPTIVDQSHGDRVQVMELCATRATRDHEIGAL